MGVAKYCVLICFLLVSRISWCAWGIGENQLDSCGSSVIVDGAGKKWTLRYADGSLELEHEETIKKFSTQQHFAACVDFNFRGLYVKKDDNNWDVRMALWLMDEKLLMVTGLDEQGRCLLFVIDLENNRLLTGAKHGNDFLISRFNKVYFDPENLTLAVPGEYEEDYEENILKTNVYFSRIVSGKGLVFDKVRRLPEVDHHTVIAPPDIF